MTETRQDKTNEAGISLVDLMVAMIVSLVLIGAMLSTVVQHGHHRQAATESSLAVSAAINNLEKVRVLPESALLPLDGQGFDVPGINGGPGGLTCVPGDGDGLPGYFTVVVDQTLAGDTLYRIMATVVWTGVNGRRRIRLQALIGERK